MHKTILLFDVDGTLTEPRKYVETPILNMLQHLFKNNNLHVGIVGGSDIEKQKEQLGEDILKQFDYLFSQNGLVSFKQGLQPFHQNSIVNLLGETHMQKLINICLYYLSEINLPKKRGNFIEHRTGMLNISPIGRSCSQLERDEFYIYDSENEIRTNLITNINRQWDSYISQNQNTKIPELSFSIGGQISVDIYPKNWDKTYCLQFLYEKYDRIIFIGDKTSPGGNDFEIFESPLTESYTTTGPNETINIVNELVF